MQDKKKLNEIATPFQRHYLQFWFLLSVNQKGLSKKMLKRVWQVVETFVLPQKSLFCWNLRKFRIRHFFPDFVGSSRRKLYEKQRSAIFLVLDKNCERYLARRWGTSTAGRSTRFLITRLIMRCCMSHKFFFELQIYKKISPKLCLIKLFISLPKTHRKNRWISAF